MPLNRTAVRRCLRDGRFEDLFIEELGWDLASTPPLDLQVDGQTYLLRAIAQKRGLIALELRQPAIPPYALRRKIETQVARRYREHFILYVDAASEQQVWQWVRREQGRPLQSREHLYRRGQSGEALIQKLEYIRFTLDQEDDLSLVDVVGQVRAAFNVERATKKFYREFKKEHDAFQKFLQGIPDDDLESWYVSVMLNRLMFIYFIQKKGFLDGDANYLRHKLDESEGAGPDRYYRDFLCPLFFEGFAKPESQRDLALRQRLGRIPYLDGGIFQQHQVEQLHGQSIQIPDQAFRRLFDFFDCYQWHLDDRPLRDDNEINPDVLGYIFEQYINQKQMGAYYTKEDITEYISKNTIIPFLFDRAQQLYPAGFRGDDPPWSLLQADPDRYIYEAVRKGVDRPLPPEIEAGIRDVSQRGKWNTRAPDEYALPTEIWRETVARRQRYEEVWLKLLDGEVREINDLITLNLDIRQFAQDVIEQTEDPGLVRAFWKAATGVTVLDPTCGSGAFLFAALNILKPIYEACLDRMQQFVNELPADASPHKFRDFRDTLAEIAHHPNRDYYILKRIMVDNLYGVDIMEEATEIAKLRLFLKLVAQVDDVARLEPLPDIDFNIRAGNTLVGFAHLEDVERALKGVGTEQERLLLLPEDEALLAEIQEEAEHVERLFRRFRQMQTAYDVHDWSEDFVTTKAELHRRLAVLDDRLDRLLALQYGVDPDKQPKKYEAWLKSHQPFHWFVEFYGIMDGGGFGVAIGNPPYVELKSLTTYQLKGYSCKSAGNLYALIMERSMQTTSPSGLLGFIVPVSSVSTDRYASLQNLIASRQLFYSSYDDRPSRLFDGLEHIRLTIHIFCNGVSSPLKFSTRYQKWFAVERPNLFHKIVYVEPSDSVIRHSLPKFSSRIELGILRKMLRQERKLGTFIVRNSEHRVYYSRKVGYFLQVLNFVPQVLDGQGNRRHPSEFKEIGFINSRQAHCALCCLNSHLFYWFITTHSDCRHVNKREVQAFLVDLARLAKSEIGDELQELSALLMHNLEATSENKTMRFAHDTLTIQTIYPKLSLPILNRIDAALARFYDFTDEELDFIINYDIKYRMGDALFENHEVAE